MAKTFRFLLVLTVFGVVLASAAGTLLAAQGGPAGGAAGADFRGPGNYLSVIKIAAFWLVFLAWVYTTDWVSTDCQELKLDYLRWNPIVFGVFMAAFLLACLIPLFWIGFVLLALAYVAPLAAYVVFRNSKVGNHERVLTAEHLRYWLAMQLRAVGVQISTERREPHELGAPVTLTARGGPDDRTDNARLVLARQSPGFRLAREIIAGGLAGRASAIMLDCTQQGVAVRTMVDGVWIPREATEREIADAAIESLKVLCGLNPKDRQSRQQGAFGAEYESMRYAATFVAQGTPGGERVLLQLEDSTVRFKTLDDLGMRPKLQEQLAGILESDKGIVLLSAAPGGGLRNTTDVVLRACDRYIREFAAVEDEGNRYQAIENIPVTTYSAAEGESPADVLVKLLRTQPNVVVVRDLVNAETVGMLCKEAADDRLIIATVRAKDCAEALLRVLALGAPARDFAKSVIGVLSQRLVRKLCNTCKEAYTPTPQVLQQLGIPAGRVQSFYRPPQPNPEQPKEPCEACGGIGYLGRTAIFELLTVDSTVRKALTTSPKLDIVRQAARKDGMQNIQEEGALLVVKGVTSLAELMRVLKQ